MKIWGGEDMTLEERLDAHDEYVRLATRVLAENQGRLEAHGESIRLLTQILAGIERRIEQNEQRIEQNEALLEEARRDSAQTRRLWAHLAQRYGWLDDDETPG